MKKSMITMLLLAAAMIANAVPARRDWQTRIQPDGTTIEIQQRGDEFYHFMINRDGQQVKINKDGYYEVVGEAPAPAKVKERHAANKARRVRKQFGISPNLAPKGIVIMVNFSDKEFRSEHSRDVIDSLCNAKDCKVNKSGGTMYPSAAQYFSDQSHGKYNPFFDVYGPVTLSGDVEHYGTNGDDNNDARAANMIVEACKLVDEQYDADFTKYDSDDDGIVDFVYVIYAGRGEASGGSSSTIWPHSYSINEQIETETYFTMYPDEFEKYYGEGAEFVPYFMEEYALEDCFVDDKQINTYACSNELFGSNLDGIGTLCHEFGHVMGLPDFYDINYDTNFEQNLTPSEWDIMDGGAYNGDGHCPPNYNVWEKYFFGWHTPVNLGSEGHNLQLIANGLEGYQAYQITAGDALIGPTDSLKNNAPVYYIENRQKQGWDRGLPAHGMLIWKVLYSPTAWSSNEPNCEENQPRFTIICSSGSQIGKKYGESNVFPSGSVKSWQAIAGKPLTEITEKDGIISLVYINPPTHYYVTWMADGEVLETAKYAIDGSEDLVLPSDPVETCDEGIEFVGWTAEKQWFDPFEFPADMFGEASGKVTQDATYNAVFWELPLPCCDEE